jgi:hypothetical protein
MYKNPFEGMRGKTRYGYITASEKVALVFAPYGRPDVRLVSFVPLRELPQEIQEKYKNSDGKSERL